MGRLTRCAANRPSRLVALWVSVLAILLAPAVPAEVANESGGDGLVWRIEGPRGALYIAGSMHLLRRERPMLPAGIRAAYAEAESLVMELDTDEVDDTLMARQMLRAATFDDRRTLREVIGDERWSMLQPVLANAQVPESFAMRLEPWGVAIVLTTLEYARLGFDPAIGVEKQLLERAIADRKPIAGLETPQFQIGLFDSLPMTVQLQLLEMTLEDIVEMPQTVDELYAAWRNGDVQELDTLLLEGYASMPKLYDDVVRRRNEDWLPKIKALLDDQGDTLVIVGALHLVGKGGLIAMLEREGLQPQRFRPKKQ